MLRGHCTPWMALLLALFAASAAGPAAADDPVERLTVASWNVAHFYANDALNRGDRRKYRRSPEDLARLRAYAAALDADVILFQELDGRDAARRLLPEGYCVEASPRDSGNPLTGAQRLVVAFRSDAPCAPRVRWLTALGLPGAHLRFGAGFEITLGARTIRLLGVHLKSGCHAAPLDLADRLPDDADRREMRRAQACARLAQQLPILERWIEARTAEGGPFILFGDFNRRFGVEGTARDGAWMWPVLSDGDPDAQRLVRPTRFRRAPCWKGARYPRFIDHFVMNEEAAALVALEGFDQPVYDAPFAGEAEMAWRLSDHCAIRLRLEAPPERTG